MINYKFKKEPVSYISSVSCDICGKDTTEFEDGRDEMISIDRVGGYFSIFGDMKIVQLDMCQHCFKSKLGKYVRVIRET